MDDLRPRPSLLRSTILCALALLATAPALIAQDRPKFKIEADPADPTKGIVITIDETEGLPIPTFIKIAQGITGRVFTFTKTEIEQDQNVRISFVGPLKIKRDNFFSFFQTMLYMKGFACILRDLKDSEIVQIVAMNGAARNEIQNAAKYVQPEDIASYANQTGVQILTSITLEHVNAQTAQNSLRPFFGAQATTPGGLNFTPVGNRAFLMIGFGPQVHAAHQLLKLVDVPADVPDQEVRVQRLDNAAAEEIEPLLNDLLNDRSGGARAPAAAGVTGADLVTGQPIRLKILAHTPLNAILLSGTKEQIIDAQDLIARLDIPVEVSGGDALVLRLQNVLSKELRTTVNQFITEDQAAEQAAQGPGAAGAAGGQARRVRKTVVVSHDESNSLLLSGTKTRLETIRKLITEKLDARQPQVLVECAVVELTTGDLTKLGVELGLLDTKASGKYTRGFGFTNFGLSTFQDTDDNGLPDTRLPDFENPLQGVTGGIISGGDFGIPLLLNALTTDSKANVLSLPSVVVNNNQNAVVKTTEERPTQNTTQGTATTQSGFQGFQPAGIELNISPSISTNNYLRLNINLTVSRFLTPFDPTSSTPGVRATRQVTTQVTLPSGATMVLGGVIEDREADSSSGIPFLKDIPLLGYLFRNTSSEKNKTNLYFFLTPHILDEIDFQDLLDLSFRKKLEAADYIGHRRIQMLDRKWTGKRGDAPEKLEDPGATIDDLDKRGGYDMPYRPRPGRDGEKLPKGTMPAGPSSGTATRPSTQK